MGNETPLPAQTAKELEAAIEAVIAENSEPPERIDELSRKAFEALSGGVVRPKHAEEAMLRSDDFATLRFGDAPDLHLATKRVRENNFVVLAIGSSLNQTTVLQAAYRLYGSEIEVAELVDHAPLAFHTLLERFGNRFQSQPLGVLFVPSLSLPIQGGPQRTLEVGLGIDMSPGSHWALNTAARQVGDRLELSWPFVIDLVSYEAAARANGWND